MLRALHDDPHNKWIRILKAKFDSSWKITEPSYNINMQLDMKIPRTLWLFTFHERVCDETGWRNVHDMHGPERPNIERRYLPKVER